MSAARVLLLLPLLTLTTAAMPSLSQLEVALVEAEQAAERARVIGHATAALQNALGERLERGTFTCADPTTTDLVARVRHLGHAYRDATQAFRVRAERVAMLGGLPTVAPLLDGALGARVEGVLGLARDEVSRYRTTSGLHAALVERAATGCDAPLRPGPGLAPPSDTPVAVIGIGAGRICPADQEAAGAVVVLRAPRACLGGPTCDCTPAPVGHGAVLGEEP